MVADEARPRNITRIKAVGEKTMRLWSGSRLRKKGKSRKLRTVGLVGYGRGSLEKSDLRRKFCLLNADQTITCTTKRSHNRTWTGDA